MILDIQAAKGLVFNPYLGLDSRIKQASTSIADVLSEIDRQLDKGKGRNKAVKSVGDDIRTAMQKHLATARLEGFQHAVKHSGVPMSPMYGKKIADAAKKRAGKVNDWMTDTTRKQLKLTPDSQYILSPDRALTVARFETGRAYFRGVRDGYRGADFLKKWITEEGDSCPDCLLNEDEGRINVDAEFDSGHWGPPAHLNCPCWLVFTR